MSIICIRVAGELAVQVAAKIAAITGESIALVRQRGRSGCLIERELFRNDHEDVAMSLMSVLDLLDQHAVDYQLYELVPGESIDSVSPDDCRISSETLLNILSEWETG